MIQQYTVKLSFEDATRRVSFPSQPTWSQIAARIETHFHIPLHRAAVKYKDSDGDEILISTDEELQEYYDSEPTTVKLTVHRLMDSSPADQGGNEPHKNTGVEPRDTDQSEANGPEEATQRPPTPTRQSRTLAPSPSLSDDDDDERPVKGKEKQRLSVASKNKGKSKGKNKGKNKGRKRAAQVASPERAASSNQTHGSRHQPAPSGAKRNGHSSAQSSRGRQQHNDNKDDDEDDDDDNEDEDEADEDEEDEDTFDDGPEVRESLSITLDINDDDSNSDSDSSSSSSDSEDDAPPRGKNKKKGGKRRQQDSQQDAAGPMNMNPWGNNFASPPPMWGGGFPGQFGGSFGWSSSSSKSGKGGKGGKGSHRPRAGNLFTDVNEEIQSHFPGFNMKTWKVTPNAMTDIFSNMRSGPF